MAWKRWDRSTRREKECQHCGRKMRQIPSGGFECRCNSVSERMRNEDAYGDGCLNWLAQNKYGSYIDYD